MFFKVMTTSIFKIPGILKIEFLEKIFFLMIDEIVSCQMIIYRNQVLLCSTVLVCY